MVKVVPNHTLETLRDIKNSLNFYEKSEDPNKYKDAIKKEKSFYQLVLEQTTGE
jgi:hypothetical protein